MKNYSRMKVAQRTVLAIALLTTSIFGASTAYAAGNSNDMNQRLMQAGMGNIRNISIVKCNESQLLQLSQRENTRVSREECAKQLIAEIINEDGKKAVKSVVKLMLDAGVIINTSNINFYQCHQFGQGSLWGTQLITDVASINIILDNPPSGQKIKSNVDSINNYCDPNQAKSFIGIVRTLNAILTPVKSARQKEALRIQDISIAEIRAEEAQQHEDQVKQQQKQIALNRKRKEQKAQEEIRQQEQMQAVKKRRDEYIASIKSGQSPIRTVRDGAIMMDAEDASMMVYQPVVAATGRVYSGFGVLQSWNNNFMVLNLGKKQIDLLVTGETNFMNESHDRLRIGGTIFYVGKYLGAPYGDASFSVNYISDHQ